MIFNRLAIGTANWGKEYNGAKVSEDDQKRILDYCREVGIDMIDTATAYEWDWTKIDPWFKVVVKVRKGDCLSEICETNANYIMAHSGKRYHWLIDSLSLYEPKKHLKFNDLKILQIPYSLYDRRFESLFPKWKEHYDFEEVPEIHVRSVFLRGKILEGLTWYSPWMCMAFCLMNPYVDRVIIGVDSYEQFLADVQPLREMVEAKKEDENLLDPRKW
jgi:aryl-alcohol dehydrogenase-like predicted oxidoreductase